MHDLAFSPDLDLRIYWSSTCTLLMLFLHCVNSPCLLGSKCFDTFGSYHCVCLPGSTGPNCSIDLQECASFPCMNGGTCVENTWNDITGGGYKCTCPAQFNGRYSLLC